MEELKGHNLTQQKDPDMYNLSAVKAIGQVINKDTLTHDEKLHKLKGIIDAVYVDGWNHGNANIKKERRAHNSAINAAVNKKEEVIYVEA
ncbi:hypothetical protein [Zhongshania sp.]|uniref:hypothetical protein n=1 Tax=Zhongshania sp. TaxID=1971902 RepID=UPI00356A0F44